MMDFSTTCLTPSASQSVHKRFRCLLTQRNVRSSKSSRPSSKSKSSKGSLASFKGNLCLTRMRLLSSQLIRRSQKSPAELDPRFSPHKKVAENHPSTQTVFTKLIHLKLLKLKLRIMKTSQWWVTLLRSSSHVNKQLRLMQEEWMQTLQWWEQSNEELMLKRLSLTNLSEEVSDI